MKELKSLNRTLVLLEGVHLCLMCWCLSLSLLFLVPEYPPVSQLLWALGAAIPTLAIWAVCISPLAPAVRVPVCLGVCGLCMLLPTGILRLCWTLCAGLIALAGCFLHRPDGKVLMTVPKPWHAMAFLTCFGMARFIGGALPAAASAALVLLYILNNLLYSHSRRLRSLLCDPRTETLSAARMVRNGRIMVWGFVFAAAAVLVAVPLLVTQPDQHVEWTPAAEDPMTPPTEDLEEQMAQLRPGGLNSDRGDPESTEIANRIVLRVFVIFMLASLALSLIGLILRLLWIENGKKRNRTLTRDAGLTVEPLPPETAAETEPEPPAEGWEKRIRRRYQSLIASRAAKGSQLSPLTPTQLEQTAGLPEGEARSALHALYEKARYGSEACSREDDAAVKAAVRRLRKEH